MENADFGRVLGQRAITKCHMTSHPVVKFFCELGLKRCAKSHGKAHRDMPRSRDICLRVSDDDDDDDDDDNNNNINNADDKQGY